MAINLFTLDKPEATLVRAPIQPVSHRLNTDKIKENWEQLKSESKDLVQISREAASYESSVSLDGLKHVGELDRNYCNYSSDVFFRSNMPQVSTDGNYLIGGVTFSKEELEQCRMVMKAAADSIGCGVGKNTNIDYKNYAQMSIAESSVKAYASEHLSEEQAAVVNKAMQEYNQALIDLEKQTMSDGNYVKSHYEGQSDYYGTARLLTDGEIEALNKVKEELSRITGRYYEPSVKGVTAVVVSATNEELKKEITDLFTDLDVTDEKSVNAAMEKYKELMRPAYIAYGMNDTHGSLTKILNQDAANFKIQISNLLLAANYHATDYSI